eukprot:320744-Prymnesium_polylepis.1
MAGVPLPARRVPPRPRPGGGLWRRHVPPHLLRGRDGRPDRGVRPLRARRRTPQVTSPRRRDALDGAM